MKKMICVLFALLLTASMGGCQVMDEALVESSRHILINY